VDQDATLSRLRPGFEFLWGHKPYGAFIPYGFFYLNSLPLLRLQNLKSPKTTSLRDSEIHRLHIEEKRIIPSLAKEFGLAENSIWGICNRMRKRLQVKRRAFSL
jgi:hypothetical protein